jgi:hypothetical protein
MAGIDDVRPLDAAIDEIRLLHGAAERAADRLGADVQRLADRGSGTQALVADVADALVERTESIRHDCRRLERLLERARAAVAGEARPLPQPASHYPPPRPEDVMASSGPVVPIKSFEASRRGFFGRLRGRAGDSSGAMSPPNRLPRPDFLAAGVEAAADPRDRRPQSHPPMPEGVRLIATQMAIAGASRVEVERRLERQFGIVDAGPALDEIFGYQHPAASE